MQVAKWLRGSRKNVQETEIVDMDGHGDEGSVPWQAMEQFSYRFSSLSLLMIFNDDRNNQE